MTEVINGVVYPTPTQQNSKTVTSIAIPWLRVVLNADPNFEKEKHDELQYPFGENGHRARNFYADPYISGAYAPPVPGYSPVNTVPPVITGLPIVGEVLTGDDGTWTGQVDGFDYQWYRDGSLIPGATGLNYRLQQIDYGTFITFGSQALNFVLGDSAFAISAPTQRIMTQEQYLYPWWPFI